MPNIRPTSCAANMRAMASPPVISSFSDMRVMLLVGVAPAQQGVDEGFERRADAAAQFAGASVGRRDGPFLVAGTGVADAGGVRGDGQGGNAALVKQGQAANAGAVLADARI